MATCPVLVCAAPDCSAPFNRTNGGQRYCSKACQERTTGKNSTGRKTPPPPARDCAECGQPFQPRRTQQRFCRRACTVRSNNRRMIAARERPRTCKASDCENAVTGTGRSYCSEACKHRAGNARRPTSHHAPRTCLRPDCEAPFTPTDARRVYCGATCRDADHARRTQELREAEPLATAYVTPMEDFLAALLPAVRSHRKEYDLAGAVSTAADLLGHSPASVEQEIARWQRGEIRATTIPHHHADCYLLAFGKTPRLPCLPTSHRAAIAAVEAYAATRGVVLDDPEQLAHQLARFTEGLIRGLDGAETDVMEREALAA